MDNQTLDSAIVNRKSTRIFKNEIPPKELIDDILKSGLYAPYSGLTGMSINEVRKFIVIRGDSEKMNILRNLMYQQIKKKAKVFNILSKIIPKLRKDGGNFNKRIQNMANHGIPTLDNAPYLIIVAEKKGIPASANLSIAHTMENMWLKATSLELGFQMLSVTKIMMKNKTFMAELGLEYNKYEIDGCIIGYPVNNTKKSKYFNLDDYVKYF